MVTVDATLPEIQVEASVHLWLATSTPGPWSVMADTLQLSCVELAKADRFLDSRTRSNYLAAHTFSRRVLSRYTASNEKVLRFRHTRLGRPILTTEHSRGRLTNEMIDFNVSHTGRVVMMGVVAGRRIGIDLEYVPQTGVMSGHDTDGWCTPEEQAWISGLAPAERPRGVLRLWTLKEAYAKARGLGLTLPFETFSFMFDSGGELDMWHPPRNADGRWWFLELEPLPGLLLAVAVSAGCASPEPIRIYYGCPESTRTAPVPVRLAGKWVSASENDCCLDIS
jgi:4'-phosphopantetheinyl transferase